jgi:adenylate cyclase
MTSENSVNNVRSFNRLPVLGLKFRIIIPFLILIAIMVMVLAGVFRLSSQNLPELLTISFVTLLVTIGLGLVIARQLSQRISQIINAATRVAGGDLSVRIVDKQEDEIGRLAQTFNEMVSSLDQLHSTRDLLSRTMSPAVRQVLLQRGLDFRGITQVVSILFIDIRDFTYITERYNTEQLIFFLNDYYTTIANQVQSGGGIIGKYGGDSILAYFGAPKSKPRSEVATAALLTALALQDSIEQMNQRWGILGLPPIRVGIGLSMGPVVAGPIGSEEQFEYTVIGDAVNVASRLQDLTRNVPSYNVILSSEVYEVLEERIKTQIQVVRREDYEALAEAEKARRPIQFIDLDEVLIKGKRGPIHVYGIPA